MESQLINNAQSASSYDKTKLAEMTLANLRRAGMHAIFDKREWILGRSGIASSSDGASEQRILHCL